MDLKLSAEDLAQHLAERAPVMVARAHLPEHWVRTWLGEGPPPEQRYAMKLLDWETRVVFAYTVDLVPVPLDAQVGDTPGPQEARPHRHLSRQISVPGEVTQGELNVVREHVLSLFQPVVPLFFPLAEAVGVRFVAHAPIPGADPARRPGSLPAPGARGRPAAGRRPPDDPRGPGQRLGGLPGLLPGLVGGRVPGPRGAELADRPRRVDEPRL